MLFYFYKLLQYYQSCLHSCHFKRVTDTENAFCQSSDWSLGMFFLFWFSALSSVLFEFEFLFSFKIFPFLLNNLHRIINHNVEHFSYFACIITSNIIAVASRSCYMNLMIVKRTASRLIYSSPILRIVAIYFSSLNLLKSGLGYKPCNT